MTIRARAVGTPQRLLELYPEKESFLSIFVRD